MTDDEKTEQTTSSGTRPPFSASNLAALKIGSRSPRVYGRVAERISEDLLEALPHLAAFPEELAALASTEAIAALLRIELAGGARDKNGDVRFSLLDRYFRAEAAAAKRRDAIGLSPLGEAVLARERASAAAIASHVDLEALAARGRAALDAHQPDLVLAAVQEVKDEYAAERDANAAEWNARTQDSRPALPSEPVEGIPELEKEN